MRDRDSVFELLEIIDTDEDFLIEAAMDALIHIKKAFPDSIISLIFDFIARRIFHDPNYSRLAGYEILEFFIDREEVKRFFIEKFDTDEAAQDFIAGSLVKTKDKRLLELFKRAMEFAKQVKDESNYKEIKWSYFYLDQGKTFSEPYDIKKTWEEDWQKRWGFIFRDMAKTEQEKEKEKKELEKGLDKISKKSLSNKDKKELEKFKIYPIAPFCLEKYLEIRERFIIEEKFQTALTLLGLSNKWTVEQVQMLINENKKVSEVLDIIFQDFIFLSREAMEIFTKIFQELWNITPREEFNGLSPNQKI